MAAVLIAGAVFIIWPKVKKSVSNDADTASDWLGRNSPEINVSDKVSGAEAQFKTFVHPVRGFSFDYPADWSADAFLQDTEEAVMVGGQNQETGIAIFIYPFDETGAITKKRILKDVPDIKIQNETALKISGIDALGFDSNEREFGPTKEVWFVHSGFLYQIAASAGSGEVLYMIVESWKFQ